jgi:flagellum-specific peptidoglycan hydrolase FlgJ
MDLNDLLVSYKQVRTPTKPIPAIPVIEQPIYQEAPTVKTEEPLTETADNPTTKYYISSIQAPGFKAKWNSPYKDKNKWATDLANSYRKAGITNDNAIRMLVSQDALESAWGRSAQGKFNFGNLTTGAKWKGDYVTGNDKNAKGEAIKQRFRSYNSMDEYAADKVQFLKRLYDFNENDDINKFTAKLTGANKGKRRYAEATNYADSLTKVFNSFKKGGVIKAQEGFRLNWNPNAGSSIDIVNTAK